ncbi:2-polyprenyl-3-methyl-5-hydroxy-6-metoxy-1,4-benzoquinol methylase [Flavobacterium aquaticum]|uniref:2-polyprenyl-3-methyl-5-hydroxy-6-metoxy-1, 4-benzoquinol methylase n=1 Tax=Flavobacterium aquaticum TaxID=1236486 RepID=A0A327YS04_9FLAO|nr:class I SAM-dependent methyltransferase [Flavobacterium aquaticum]RAK23693.1 2-polyprenyl-3-methyl-5-hydroxy-6-metoxy-1,4-benzoquinol methylase [Flavobacterium aquaticum]
MNFLEDKSFITVKDFSVSGESFSLLLNEEYQILKTHPQPTLDKLGSYYEFEDYISHTDGKRTMFEKMYHFIKRKAIRDKVKLLNSYQPVKGRILDIGAGTGDFLLECKNQNWDILGIEPNDKAKGIALGKGIKFGNTIEKLESNSFDVITMWHVLEHVPDVEHQVAELKRLLKPSGTIIIAVPNFKSYDAKYYKEFWAAYDVPRHLWHFSKTAIEKLFDKQNMNLEDIKPMWFDSFYVSLLSEKYKSGKMNFISGFFIGLISNVSGFFKKEFSSHIYVLKNK